MLTPRSPEMPASTRRSFLRVTGLSALALAATPAWRASAAGKEFDIMTVGGSWQEAIDADITAPFAKRHTLTVNYDIRENAQQVASLQAQRNSPTINVVELGGAFPWQANSLGLIERLDDKDIPNYKSVHDSFKTPFYAARSIAPFGMAFRREKVSKDDVLAKGWDILLDRRLKGKVAIPKYGWQGQAWLYAVNLAVGGTSTNLDPGIGLARRVIRENGGRVMESNDHGLQLFTTGELWAAPFWSGRTFALQEKGVPLDFAYVKGWMGHMFGFCIVKGSRDQDLSRQYVDWSLSPEVQVSVARKFKYAPTNTRTQLPPELSQAALTREDLERAAKLDYTQIAANADASLERWNKEVLG